MPSFEVDGKIYNSWEELPPEVREKVARAMPDEDGDGVPAFLQEDSMDTSASVTSTTRVEYAGKTYESWGDLPPEVRRVVGDRPPDSRPGQTVHAIEVNGKVYESLDDLPPDLRRSIKESGLAPEDAQKDAQKTAGATAGTKTREPQPRPEPGPTLLNGVPLEPGQKRKHWWQRR
ncbi:MAG: hypothetical protein L0H93_23335 [Nocardioides sp.]|nr:hypothetical protein [Nocardioides sp.]